MSDRDSTMSVVWVVVYFDEGDTVVEGVYATEAAAEAAAEECEGGYAQWPIKT